MSIMMSVVMKSLAKSDSAATKKFLNLLMPRVIPFNRPLGLNIRRLSEELAEIEIPFKRANKNHLGGLHACALATVGEYTAGILVLRRMDPTRQRLVLKTLHVDFLKQGRGAAIARAEWPSAVGSPSVVASDVASFRKWDAAAEFQLQSMIRSMAGVELARVQTTWQVKPWAQVRQR